MNKNYCSANELNLAFFFCSSCLTFLWQIFFLRDPSSSTVPVRIRIDERQSENQSAAIKTPSDPILFRPSCALGSGDQIRSLSSVQISFSVEKKFFFLFYLNPYGSAAPFPLFFLIFNFFFASFRFLIQLIIGNYDTTCLLSSMPTQIWYAQFQIIAFVSNRGLL